MDVVSISVAKNQLKDVIDQGSTTTGDLICQDPDDETGGLIQAGTIAGLDNTLKLNTHAAPAKTVGDKFDALQSDITGKVGDVQINGTSIKDADGVANIPIGNYTVGTGKTLGVVAPHPNSIGVSSEGLLYVKDATNTQIENRSYNAAVTGQNVNTAVTAALTDSNHLTMTEDQMDTCCSVIGASRQKPYVLIQRTTVAETGDMVINVSGYTSVIVHVIKNGSTSVTLYFAGYDTENKTIFYPNISTANEYGTFWYELKGGFAFAYSRSSSQYTVSSNTLQASNPRPYVGTIKQLTISNCKEGCIFQVYAR